MSSYCKWFLDNQSSFKAEPKTTLTTITKSGNSYIVHRNDGTVIKCHNYATASWYAKNPDAK